MAVSNATRSAVVAALAAKGRKANAARGHAEADRDDLKEARIEKKVAGSLARKLENDGGWMAGAVLRKGLSSAKRDVFDGAIAQLLQARQIEAETVTGTGQAGVHYRWIG
jgi:hypothetical protein